MRPEERCFFSDLGTAVTFNVMALKDRQCIFLSRRPGKFRRKSPALLELYIPVTDWADANAQC